MQVPTKIRAIPVAIVCMLAAVWAIQGLGWEAWVMSWAGSTFKAASGATGGYLFARYVLQIDISEIRARYVDPVAAAIAAGLAGIALALIVGLCGMAVALGA